MSILMVNRASVFSVLVSWHDDGSILEPKKRLHVAGCV